MERLRINSSSALVLIPLLLFRGILLLFSLSCLIKDNFLGTALTEVDGKSSVTGAGSLCSLRCYTSAITGVVRHWVGTGC